MPVDQAVEEIKGPAKVNEVMPKVAPEDRADVFNKLRMEKATELQKQAMPAGGARPGTEMSPAMVQTSSQTAMAKADEENDDAALTDAMKDLKRQKRFRDVAKLAQDMGEAAERSGDAKTAQAHYKTALRYHNKHAEQDYTGKPVDVSVPKTEAVTVPRKVGRDTEVRRQFEQDLAPLQEELRSLTKPKTEEEIKNAQDPKIAPQRLKRIKELNEQILDRKQKFGAAALGLGDPKSPNYDPDFEDPDTKSALYDPNVSMAAEQFRAQQKPVSEEMPKEFLEQEETRQVPGFETKRQYQGRADQSLSSRSYSPDSRGSLTQLTGPGVRGVPGRSSKFGPSAQAQAEHMDWFLARQGAKGGSGLRPQGAAEREVGDATEGAAQEAQSVVSQPNYSPGSGEFKRKVKPKSGGGDVVAGGGAAEYAARIAELKARQEAAQKQKVSAEAQKPQEIPSANEGFVAMPKAEIERRMKEKQGASDEQAAKSMYKSAEQAKNPAFMKRPKEGTVAGEIPESDIVGDYSKRMGEEKSVNDKPAKKQGFGSAETLKKAHSLLKKKYK